MTTSGVSPGMARTGYPGEPGAHGPAPPVRLLLVDEPIMREGISAMLYDACEVAVVGQAGDPATALQALTTLAPDVAMVAARLGHESGFDLCRRLVARRPRTAVIVLSSYGDPDAVLAAWQAGARGYLLTRVDSHELVSAATAVSAGEPFLDPRLGGQLASRLAAETDATPPVVPPQRSAFRDDLARLSRREREVLGQMTLGLSNADIAHRLFISQETVRSHVKAILRKLQASDRSHAVSIALRGQDPVS